MKEVAEDDDLVFLVGFCHRMHLYAEGTDPMAVLRSTVRRHASMVRDPQKVADERVLMVQ